jgi:hypothetical protein
MMRLVPAHLEYVGQQTKSSNLQSFNYERGALQGMLYPSPSSLCRLTFSVFAS